MSTFTDCFALAPAASGDVVTANGDWHGQADVMVNANFDGGDHGKAVAVLAALHDAWPTWRAGLIASLEAQHGLAEDVQILAVHAYDGDGVEGYFEIEFAAPDLFGEDLAMAVGTLGGGIEDVGIPG